MKSTSPACPAAAGTPTGQRTQSDRRQRIFLIIFIFIYKYIVRPAGAR